MGALGAIRDATIIAGRQDGSCCLKLFLPESLLHEGFGISGFILDETQLAECQPRRGILGERQDIL